MFEPRATRPTHAWRDETGFARPLVRITLPSKGEMIPTVMVKFMDTLEVRRVPARDLVHY